MTTQMIRRGETAAMARRMALFPGDAGITRLLLDDVARIGDIHAIHFAVGGFMESEVRVDADPIGGNVESFVTGDDLIAPSGVEVDAVFGDERFGGVVIAFG